MSGRVGIFDLDGTLVDSDAALAGAFVALGVAPEHVTFGHVLDDECARLGISLDDYLDAYDPSAVHPFPGVDELVAGLDRWAICSNKHPRGGHAELDRLGWKPEVVMFADAFGGPKRLEPVLAALGLAPSAVVLVGDTAHDRTCAQAVGCDFVLAGWNPRALAERGDVIAEHPAEVLTILAGSTAARD